MRYKIRTTLIISFLACIGCVSASKEGHDSDKSWLSATTSKTVQSLSETFKPLSNKSRTAAPPLWDWATCIPSNTMRADLLQMELPADAVARVIPDFDSSSVMLASTHQPPSQVRIKAISDTTISNFAQLNEAVNAVLEKGEPVQVDFSGTSNQQSVRIQPEQLVALMTNAR